MDPLRTRPMALTVFSVLLSELPDVRRARPIMRLGRLRELSEFPFAFYSWIISATLARRITSLVELSDSLFGMITFTITMMVRITTPLVLSQDTIYHSVTD